MTSLARFLERCDDEPERIAIIDGEGRALTYGALAKRSAELAAAWRGAGLDSGDRAMLALPLGLDLYVALAALWRAGAVVVLPEPAMGLAGVRHAARIAKPRWLCASRWYRLLRVIVPELRRSARPLRLTATAGGGEKLAQVTLGEDDPALISFTSGSTGAPKGIVRSHGLLAAQNRSVAELLETGGPPSTDLVAFPVFVLANLAAGNTSVLPAWNVRRHHEAKAQDIAAQIGRDRITRLLVPPAICETLQPVAATLRLKSILTGGGPIFPDVVAAIRAAAPDTDVVAVYGSTEAEPIAHVAASEMTSEDWEATRSGGGLLAGRPSAAARVRIIDDEIVVTGDHVNKGYIDPAQDVTTKLGIDGEIWHRTGDAGRFDKDGKLWLLGRLDGRAGPHFPFAIETAARTWPGVRRAALATRNGAPVLVIEGARETTAEWRGRAASLGIDEVAWVAQMPLDRRHRSKIDYRALRDLIDRRN